MGEGFSCPTIAICRTTCHSDVVVLHSENVGQLARCGMQEIDLATQTMFAELLQRSLDAEFDESFEERGTFRRKKSKGRFYWHHQVRVGDMVMSSMSARSPSSRACFGMAGRV